MSTTPIDIAERRREEAVEKAVENFQLEVTRLALEVVLLTCPGISPDDVLKQAGVLLRMIAEECDAATITTIPPARSP